MEDTTYYFLLAHGYEIYKGYIKSKTKEEAIKCLQQGQWDDVIDEYDSDEFVEGYEVEEIWE